MAVQKLYGGKNMMNKKLFGMPIAVFLVGILLIGGATAALMTYFGQVQTEVNIDQGLKLDGNNWDEPVTQTINAFSVQSYFGVTSHVLTNDAGVDAEVKLVTECEEIETTHDGCDIIEHKILRPFVDAGIQTIEEPTCDVTVEAGESIRTDGIDKANAEDVVCVEAGEYDGFIVNKPVHLVALGEVIVNGTPVGSPSAMIQVDSNDVIIEGFVVDSKTKNYAVENVGGNDNMQLRNNKFIGNTHGIYINPSANTLIENNIIDVQGVGIGSNDHTGTIVRHNIFTETIGVEVMGASGTYNVEFYENIILTDAPFNVVTGTFDAENNFFAKGIHKIGAGELIATNTGAVETGSFVVSSGGAEYFLIEISFPAGMFPTTYNLTTQVELAD